MKNLKSNKPKALYLFDLFVAHSVYIAQQNLAVLYIEVLTKITVVPLLYLKSDGLVELAGIVIGLFVIFLALGSCLLCQ